MVKVQDDDASMPVAATPIPTQTGASNNNNSIPNPLTTAVTTTTTITPNTSTPTNNNNSITTTNSSSNSTISTNSISSVSNFLPLRHHKPGRHHHHHHHHLQHAPLQHFHHFHHHWTFPDPSAPPPGPATFHFGPGFEPHRYAAGPSPGPGPTVTSNNTAGPSQGAAEHIVHFHVNPGVTVSFQIGDNMELIRGPVTVPMVSTNSSPPIAMPVQVPPGHVVQQIVDESGTLRHVILSPQPPPPQPQPAPLVPMHSHNPHNYGAGNGNSQPAQTFFPQGLPYPPPHFHSNMPPSHMGHVPTSGHLGHSPPPTLGFHKDERTQRQYNKLKRKLEQKRSDGLNSGQTTPLLSPRKELVNGLRRGAGAGPNAKERGMNSVGTSEDGEESSSVQDDEDEVNVITDILSSVQSPQVSELSSRSALLQWSVPANLSSAGSNGSPDLDICESDLKYDVLLSDKGKEGKYKSIYIGASLSCRIEDLKPGQEYSVCLQAHLEELQGSASDPITFTTPACEPDQPVPPKLITRTKTSLQLRWNAVADNGSHIVHYILEYDEGKGDGFVELFKCRGKQYSLTKLQPSTTYKFRLAALNDFGKSPYSDVISFSTSGSPPLQPAPPTLKEALIDSLRLVWIRRPTDDEFTLQMDEQTGYGFMNSYVGRDTEYLVPKLLRYTDYKFRIRASNEESASSWSEEVCFRTLPDRPGQPSRPTVKGRIHAHSFKLKWEPPHDKGGADVTTYILELCSGRNYETIYTGPETEAVCDKLTPGTTYQLRVSCVSLGGRSNYSDPCTVTTEAICPGKCSNLRLHGKPRATSVCLKWTGPDYHGGAPVTEYEVDLVNPELTTTSRQTVYRGKEPECTVTNLLPGNTYSFMARALNRVGFGPWSDVLEATSGAAPPDAPQPPATHPKSPFHVLVEWHEPNSNGAALTEYKLEMSSHTDEEEQFASVFQGLATSHDIKGLTPFTTYFFRVQACNGAGCSPYSLVSATMTPASPPAVMAAPRYHASPVSLTLNWHPPHPNGSDILYYIIELTDKVMTTDAPVTEYTIENLKPETVYKIKVKAVNSIGCGAYSPTLRAGTLPLPPAAPKLDCIGVAHNYLKLKWGDGKNSDFTQYCVEMENNRTKEFQCIYQGTNFTYKVNKLQELTTYRFRISASSDAGQGDYSDIYEFKTCIAPPAGLKAPKIIEVTQRTCSLEWAPCKILASDPIEYSVQMCRLRDQNFKEMYRGDGVKLSLCDLEPGAEYHVKVCPIRMAPTGQLQGVYSPVTSFQTVALEPALSAKQSTPLVTNSPARGRKNQRLFSWLFVAQHADKKRMSDTQWALVYILCFIVVAVLAAVLLEQLFINWRKSV